MKTKSMKILPNLMARFPAVKLGSVGSATQGLPAFGITLILLGLDLLWILVWNSLIENWSITLREITVLAPAPENAPPTTIQSFLMSHHNHNDLTRLYLQVNEE